MWPSNIGGGINPWNRSSRIHGRDSNSMNERNKISGGEREMFPVNNFSISVSNDVANYHRRAGTTEASDWGFGQTEWSRLWADKCFHQSVAPHAETPMKIDTSPSISRTFHSESSLHHRLNNQNQPARVARLSCWDNESCYEKKVSIKSRLGNGGGPIRRFNDDKVRRDRSVPVYGHNRRIHSDAQYSQKEAYLIRRSPPHVVPSPSSRRAIPSRDLRTEPEDPKEWERRQLRKLRFENNATEDTSDRVNMALDDLIAVKKNSKKISPSGKAVSSGDPKISDGISQSSDRRNFNPRIEQPVNRLGTTMPQIVKTTSSKQGKMVIVDGTSVAFEYGDQIYFDWEGINICIKRLTDFGCKCIKVVIPEDKLGKGMTKNDQHVEELQKEGILLHCRENQNYKQMMLNIACKKDAVIISNDLGKKTKLSWSGGGTSKEAVERTHRFSFKTMGSSKSIEFAKISNGLNELSLEQILHI